MAIPLGILSYDECMMDDEALAPLRQYYEIHDFRDWPSYDPQTLLEKCRSVEVLITGWQSPNLPVELADDKGRLRYVLHLRGSVRRVPKALMEKGVAVTNWGNEVAGWMAEGAMTLLLCMLKQLPALDAWTRGGPDERIWQMFEPRLSSMIVGLYGFGPIGRRMAQLLEPFGASIAVYDPYAKDVPEHYRRCQTLRELFSTCHAVSIHCGLNDTTRLSVTRELLELLPQGGIIINTARGWIVDEAALAELVEQGRLVAGIDVIHDETDWTRSPLAKCRGVVLTRHSIGLGKGFPPDKRPKEKLPDYAMHNLLSYAQGQPLMYEVPLEEYDLKT